MRGRNILVCRVFVMLDLSGGLIFFRRSVVVHELLPWHVCPEHRRELLPLVYTWKILLHRLHLVLQLPYRHIQRDLGRDKLDDLQKLHSRQIQRCSRRSNMQKLPCRQIQQCNWRNKLGDLRQLRSRQIQRDLRRNQFVNLHLLPCRQIQRDLWRNKFGVLHQLPGRQVCLRRVLAMLHMHLM